MDKLAKIKFVLLVGGGLLFTEQANAKFDGFYVGGNVGYLQQNTSISAAQNPTNPNAHVNITSSQSGLPTVEALIGYGRIFGNYYIGLEGRVDFALGGNKTVAEDTVFKLTSGRKGPGLSLVSRIGYLVTPNTMLYGGVGVKAVRFDHNFYEKGDKIPAHYSSTSLFLLTEIGVETYLSNCKNVGLRFSYSFMPQKSRYTKSTNFPAGHMYKERGVLKTSVSEHAIKFGVIYRF